MDFVVVAQYRAREGEAERASAHFSTWLAGTVLPALAGRVRLDLVPMEH